MMVRAAYLEAQDPERNIYRAYSIDYGQDLFGNWIVEVTYGRIGSRGRTMIRVVHNEGEALRQVQKFIQRRQSSLKRIGISYKLARQSNYKILSSE